MCVIFFLWSYVITYYLKKKSFMHATLFLPNLDFVELLGVFAAICHLNECLNFGMFF